MKTRLLFAVVTIPLFAFVALSLVQGCGKSAANPTFTLKGAPR